MKFLLLLLLFGSLICSCHKTDTDNAIIPKDTLYPHVDRFAGTMHVVHGMDYTPPTIHYDTLYPQVFEVVYPDSSWVGFDFYYWDIQAATGNSYLSYLAKRSVSFLKRSDSQYTFDSSQHYQSHLRISKDSLWFNKSYLLPPDEGLTVSFAGRRI